MFTTEKVNALLIEADARRRRSDNVDLLGAMLEELELSELCGCIQLWDLKDGQVTHVFGPAFQLPPGWPSIVSPGRLTQIPDGGVLCCVAGTQISEVRVLALVIRAEASFYMSEAVVELTEVLGDLYRRRLLHRFGEQLDRQGLLLGCLTLFHSASDLESVFRHLADDVAQMLQCQRITVFRYSVGGQWTPVAATGVDGLDSRSEEIARLKSMIVEAQNAASKTASLTERPTTASLVIPLTVGHAWNDAKACVVFQWLPPLPTATDRQLSSLISAHAAMAFRNIERQNSGLLGSTFRTTLHRLGSKSALAVLGGLAGVIAVLAFIPWTLTIEVPGIVQPKEHVFVFVTEPGVVKEVVVEEGDQVVLGDVVCILKNEEFEIQLEDAVGELASTNARLSALEAMRADRTQARPEVISAESAELQARSTSLEKQIALLKQRIDHLVVRADRPGTIFGDRIREILPGRPIERGQLICEIVDASQGWQINFRIPEAETRHVLNAISQSSQKIKVQYFLESDPENLSLSTMTSVGTAAQFDEAGQISTGLTADIDSSDGQRLRSGAKAIGWIDCGSRSMGFVFFRRIIEAVRRGWWI